MTLLYILQPTDSSNKLIQCALIDLNMYCNFIHVSFTSGKRSEESHQLYTLPPCGPPKWPPKLSLFLSWQYKSAMLYPFRSMVFKNFHQRY